MDRLIPTTTSSPPLFPPFSEDRLESRCAVYTHKYTDTQTCNWATGASHQQGDGPLLAAGRGVCNEKLRKAPLRN